MVDLLSTRWPAELQTAVPPPSAHRLHLLFMCRGRVGVFETFAGTGFAPWRFGTGGAPLSLCFHLQNAAESRRLSV